MDFITLFESALGLTPPWKIEKVSFDPKAEGGGAVEIRLGFARGSRFPCPECKAPGAAEREPAVRGRR